MIIHDIGKIPSFVIFFFYIDLLYILFGVDFYS